MDFDKFDFVYNAAAHFAAADKYPDGLVKVLLAGDKACFDATCWILAEMAAQGELIRRDAGYDKREIPTEAHFRARLMPHDFNAARTLILDRISKGLHGEEREDEEVDEVLAEIEKKADGG